MPSITAEKLKLYNTLTRQKDEVVAIADNHIRMYTCGPTVYNFAHIGNLRTYIFEDLLRRTLKFFDFEVTHVMNLTDVDDKTIKGALATGQSLDEFTQTYKIAFFEDIDSLKILRAHHYPAATDYIPQMIEMTQKLLEKGFAYEGGDGSIYFAIRKFPHYGCLSHFRLEELQAGASERVASDEYEKEHVADFVLWKKYDQSRDGNIFWESPFGKGRPGWHLECSAMAINLLGETLDIHCGGIDNMFPHHENEIAQSEACTDKPFVKHWLHCNHLVVNGMKMSKSLKNFYTLRDLLTMGFTGPQIRYMLLRTHYRTQLNFTFEGLTGEGKALQRLNDFIQRLHAVNNEKTNQSASQFNKFMENIEINFKNALADDLNISVALGHVFEFVRQVNSDCDAGMISKEQAQKVLEFMKKINHVLDVLSIEPEEEKIPPELQEAFEKRLQARKDKNWKLSDELRDYIHERGYMIEDTPQGARFEKGGGGNIMKYATTKDEKFMVCLYTEAQKNPEIDDPIDRYKIGHMVGLHEKAIDTICNLLAQANFIKKHGPAEVSITPQGIRLVDELKTQEKK